MLSVVRASIRSSSDIRGSRYISEYNRKASSSSSSVAKGRKWRRSAIVAQCVDLCVPQEKLPCLVARLWGDVYSDVLMELFVTARRAFTSHVTATRPGLAPAGRSAPAQRPPNGMAPRLGCASALSFACSVLSFPFVSFCSRTHTASIPHRCLQTR